MPAAGQPHAAAGRGRQLPRIPRRPTGDPPPEFICCLGAVAAQNLLGTTATIGSLRRRIHTLGPIKVVCTYHPAYLLRNPAAKRNVREDIQMLMKEMGMGEK